MSRNTAICLCAILLFNNVVRADPIAISPQECIYVLDENSSLGDINEFDIVLFVLAGTIHVFQLNDSLAHLEANLEILANGDTLHLAGDINLQSGSSSVIACQSETTGIGSFNVNFTQSGADRINFAPEQFFMSAIGSFSGGGNDTFGVHLNAQRQDVVPEPSSLALFLMCAAVLIPRRMLRTASSRAYAVDSKILGLETPRLSDKASGMLCV
jgi:hypothetical protein